MAKPKVEIQVDDVCVLFRSNAGELDKVEAAFKAAGLLPAKWVITGMFHYGNGKYEVKLGRKRAIVRT